MENSVKKVALITGATSGIGLATARLFLKKGYTVYGVARRPYTGEDFTCFCADVSDYGAMREVFENILKAEKKLDVFINNAGMGIAGAVSETSAEALEKIVEVNLTSVMYLCGMSVKYLSAGGRIINVSSVGGIMPLPYQSAYSATKAGVEIFSRALANELKDAKIKVSCVLPGDTKTGFTSARIMEGNDAKALKSVEKMAKDEQKGASPEKSAKVIYKCAKKRRPPLRVAVGAVSKLELFLNRIFPTGFVNYIIRKIYCGK